MQCFRNRSQPVEQWACAFCQFGQATFDPADLAKQHLELALDGKFPVGFERGGAGHVGQGAQPSPGEGTSLLGCLDLRLHIGAHRALGGLGGSAVGLQAGDESLS